MRRIRNGCTLAAIVACLALSAGCSAESSTGVDDYDLLIVNGRVLDGTGNPWFRADVGVQGDRIVAVGDLRGARAKRVIDATGHVVAPGFIDLHTHSDLSVLEDGNAESKVRQGVTLDVIGEGSTVAPRDGLPVEESERHAGVVVDWTTLAEYFERLESGGTSINIVSWVSAQQVQLVVKGYETRPATRQELERMRELVAREMDNGAFGLIARFESGGPQFPDEIMAMAKVAAEKGGIYATHLGSEGFEQDKELDWAIRVAEEAGLPVHIFHFKIRAQENWGTIGKYIEAVEAARARGLEITANQYPYTAMSHPWANFFPLWIREGGPEAFAERLRDRSNWEKVRNDESFIRWAKEHGWWEGIVMSRAFHPEQQQYQGMRLSEIAAAREESDPFITLMELMAQADGRVGGIYHAMSEEDTREMMRQPWVSHASDGSALNLDAPGVPHPRNFATNVRVLGHYVREEGVLTLEDAIRKMTSLPAQILRLRDRGQVREGFVADLVVFDPETVGATNSFESPKSYPTGVPYVVVNGVVVIDGYEHTGARPGRALRGPAWTGDAATARAN
ncbi:MAG TPA: D-aminoacylase [Woeseiaceae bacterium]|nr:D-aminoacylase [Woeseiaceae bacterium]